MTRRNNSIFQERASPPAFIPIGGGRTHACHGLYAEVKVAALLPPRGSGTQTQVTRLESLHWIPGVGVFLRVFWSLAWELWFYLGTITPAVNIQRPLGFPGPLGKAPSTKEPTALWIFPEGPSSLQTGCVQPCSHVPVILVGLSQFRVCCLVGLNA